MLRNKINIVKRDRKVNFKVKGVSYLLAFMIIYFLAIYFFLVCRINLFIGIKFKVGM